MSDQQLMTIEEVAKYLEIKTVTVKRYAREGLLDSSGGSPAFSNTSSVLGYHETVWIEESRLVEKTIKLGLLDILLATCNRLSLHIEDK